LKSQFAPACGLQVMFTYVYQVAQKIAVCACVQLLQSARDVPTLLRHCISAVFSMSGLAWMFRFRFIVFSLAALIYLVVPFDLIPEMLLGIIGLIDDFLIIVALAIRICIEYRVQIAMLAGAAAAEFG